jgi:hypothetical protein
MQQNFFLGKKYQKKQRVSKKQETGGEFSRMRKDLLGF